MCKIKKIIKKRYGVMAISAPGSLFPVHFSQVVEMGRVTSREPDEISGLSASRLHPGVLYAHNDHGDTNRIFAMDPVSGEVKATLTIANAHNVDWEDICVGTCGSVSVWGRGGGEGVGAGGGWVVVGGWVA